MTTWNPADKSASILLSDGNSRFDGDSSADGGVRSTVSKNAGKWYFELKDIVALDPFGNTGVGIATAAAILANFKNGGAGNDYLMHFGDLDGDVLAVALDLDNGKVWFRKDAGDWVGDAIGDPSANTNGTSIADFIPAWATGVTEVFIGGCVGGDGSATDGMKLVTEEVGMAQAIPSGFASWDAPAAPPGPLPVQCVVVCV